MISSIFRVDGLVVGLDLRLSVNIAAARRLEYDSFVAWLLGVFLLPQVLNGTEKVECCKPKNTKIS
jgi:hypothetical protein